MPPRMCSGYKRFYLVIRVCYLLLPGMAVVVWMWCVCLEDDLLLLLFQWLFGNLWCNLMINY